MTEMKLIEETEDYKIFESDYQGTKQIIRYWNDPESFEIKFTDEFAKAIGYKDRVTMAEDTGVYDSLMAYLGGLPEWVSLYDREFTFILPKISALAN